MVAKVYHIAGFPEDGRLWRIEWFGGSSFNPQVPSEPEIELSLVRLPVGETDPLSKLSCQSRGKLEVKIGVGLLPYVALASVWQNQRPISTDLTRYTTEFFIDTSQVRIMTVGDMVKMGNVIPRSHYLFGQSWSLVSETLVAVVPSNADPFATIIPVMELIRFYYAPSTRLAQALFWGEYHKSFDNEKTGFLDEGLYRVHLRRWIEDSDAWILGRFKESPLMQQQVLGLYHSFRMYYASAPELTPKPFRALRCGFPFSGKTRLNGISVSLPGLNTHNHRSLILRILRCSAPFPFEKLVADRDNNNFRGKNAGDENLPSAWKKRIEAEEKAEQERAQDTFFSYSEPLKSVEPLKIEVIESRFSDLDGKKLIKEEKEVQHYRGAPIIAGTNPVFDGLGTGEGMWGASTLQPATVNVKKPEDSKRPPVETLPATLENFFQAVLCVAATKKYDVQFVAGLAEGEVAFSVNPSCMIFPNTDLYKNKSISWAFLRTKNGLRRRQVAIAEISRKGSFCYALEIERTNQKFAVLIMARQDMGRICAKDWFIFLLDCARKGRWMSESEMVAYRRRTTTHQGFTSINVLATRISRKVDELLSHPSHPEPEGILKATEGRAVAASREIEET